MCTNGHKYRKLNEHQLFCSRCGTTLQVGGYSWTWTSPPYVPRWPNTPWWSLTTTGGTSLPNVTYTSWKDVAEAALEDPDAEGREDPPARTDG